VLAGAEERIDLMARLAPRDVDHEVARLTLAFERGERSAVTWQRREAPVLAPTRRALEAVQRAASELGPLGHLYAERAAELGSEARLVEALGTPRFRALAAERFPEPSASLARQCDDFASAALSLPEPAGDALHRSDDEADPASLVALLGRRARELGLGIEVRVSRAQLATGDGLVVVRAGVLLRAATAQRIATHELLAHALPRARARYASSPIFRAGTAGAADHEEGRAVLIEKRAGLLDTERQRELAWRHRAALGVRRGAEPHDTIASLLGDGAPLARAVELALRVHRGGGLGRELVYLPSFFEVERALAEEPALERWFERGRVGLAAARALSRTPPAPECDRTASAGDAARHRSPRA
jgi:hypothetical protein